MRKIIELIIVSILLVSWQAYGGDAADKSQAKFVKCAKSTCRYKLHIDGELYAYMSSTSDELNREVNSILDELEQEKMKESEPFCITGQKIIMQSKKIGDGKLFKPSSIGPVTVKKRTFTPYRSAETDMNKACAM